MQKMAEEEFDYSNLSQEELNQKLQEINSSLERFTLELSGFDYTIASLSGIVSGLIDSLLVSNMTFSFEDALKKIEEFRTKAKNVSESIIKNEPENLNLTSFIAELGSLLVEAFKQNGFNILKNIPDLLTHVFPVIISYLAGFLKKLLTANVDKISFIFKGLVNELLKIPNVSEILEALSHITKDDIIDCKNGLVGAFTNVINKLKAIPGVDKEKFDKKLNDYLDKAKIELRNAKTILEKLVKQSLCVILNELIIRCYYFLSRLFMEYKRCGNLNDIDFKRILPFNNRTIERMLTISELSFTITDITDATVRAIIESGGVLPLTLTKFFTKVNYVGVGRLTVSIVRENMNDAKEYNLLVEKRKLLAVMTEANVDRLIRYREELINIYNSYLASDLKLYISGLTDIDNGLKNNDIETFIRGNASIQRNLGHEIQFENQDDFDELMDSDDDFIL